MLMTSPHPPLSIPAVTLGELVLSGAADRGDHPALVCGLSGRVLSYAALADRVRRLAAGLHALGLHKGDCLAIFCPNLPEYAIVFHAVARLGAVNTTVNPLYTAEELTFQLQDCRASLLVTVSAFLDRATEAARAAGVREVLVIDGAPGHRSLADVELDAEPPQVEIDPARDVVALPYSSGTTGLPKGVMLTHTNLVANLLQVGAVEAGCPSEAYVGVLPFFHIYGMVVIMNLGLLRGATVVTLPRFELEPFLQILQDWPVALVHVVPPVVLALAKHPAVDRYDLSGVRWLFSGAAPLGAELTEAVHARLGVTIRQGYGMTEASPATHLTPSDAARPGWIGPLLPATECRLVDPETGLDVGPGGRGEVWVRGPQVMQGYLNNPEATARTVDADGWLHTGDIGEVDADGWLAVVDRLKELIKYKGYQVAPAELEALLLKHPAIADAAVVPQPDDEAGEVPKAFVVRRGELDEAAVMAFVAEHVAAYKRVRSVVFVDTIPKSASGKILRRLLRG